MTQDNAVLRRNTKDAPCCKNSTQSVAFSHYNNLSAQLPIDPLTGEIKGNDCETQARQCFKNIEAIVSSVGRQMSDLVKVVIFVKNIFEIEKVERVYQSYFKTYVPTRVVAEVKDLPCGALVQVDALLSNGEGTIPNKKQAGDLIKLTNVTNDAPVIKLEAQTVAFSHYNNLSAQLPICPFTGRLIEGGIKEQTGQCLKNIKAILTSIDVPLDDIVKINIYLTNLSDYEAVNDVYRTFFPDSGIARAVSYVPARSVISVSHLLMGARIQVEAVVSHGDGTPPQAVEDRHGLIIKAQNFIAEKKDDLATDSVTFSHYNHLSAQWPHHKGGIGFKTDALKEEAVDCLENMKAIVEGCGNTLADVVKVNICLTDLSKLPAVMDVYQSYFAGILPALRVVGVSEIMDGTNVSMDAVVSNAKGTPPQCI